MNERTKEIIKEALSIIISAAIAVFLGVVFVRGSNTGQGIPSFFAAAALFELATPIAFVIIFLLTLQAFGLRLSFVRVFRGALIALLLFVAVVKIGSTIDDAHNAKYHSDYQMIQAVADGMKGTCDGLKLSDMKSLCTAMRNNDFNACKILEQKFPCATLTLWLNSDLGACQKVYGTKGFPVDCQVVYNQRQKSLSLTNKDSSFCSRIVNDDVYKAKCFDDVAFYTRNSTLCQSDSCRQLFSKGYEYCDSTLGTRIYWCKEVAVYVNQDIQGCLNYFKTKVSAAMQTELCVQDLAALTRDRSLCDKIGDIDSRNRCQINVDFSDHEISKVFDLPSLDSPGFKD